jgi:ribosome-associated protein
MKKRQDGTDLLLGAILKGVFEKKGNDVLKIDLRNLENRITDFFIICHGSSVNQVDSLCDSVEDIVRKEAGAHCMSRDSKIVSGSFSITGM